MIGIISDIHGNKPALLAVLKALKDQGVERIFCLGDIAGYYCFINECCDLIQENKIYTIMGNHDWYLATGHDCPRSTSANDCLNYQRAAITESNLAWLRSLPSAGQSGALRMTHGGWRDPLDEYLVPSDAYFSDLAGGYFATGHLHVQYLWRGRDVVYCNPGSVGQPRDGDPRAAFATFDGKDFQLHRVEYDITQVEKAMLDAGFSHYYVENLAKGTRIGGKLSAVPV